METAINIGYDLCVGCCVDSEVRLTSTTFDDI